MDIEEKIKDIMKKTAIDYAIIIQQINQRWKMDIIGFEIMYFLDIIKIVLKKERVDIVIEYSFNYYRC